MIKKKNRIPKFKTLEEEANFWNTHEFTEFEDELEEVDIVFELNKPRDETIVLRVQKEVKDRMDKLAKGLGLNLSTLARMWLMEKLQENIRRKVK